MTAVRGEPGFKFSSGGCSRKFGLARPDDSITRPDEVYIVRGSVQLYSGQAGESPGPISQSSASQEVTQCFVLSV